MFDRFAETARNVVDFGVKEAGRRGDRRVGTEHLLIGVLHDPAIAGLLGVGVEKARAQSRALDRHALAAIGIDVGDFAPSVAMSKATRTQFTSGARVVIPRAYTLATAEKSRRIEAKHLLLALLECEEPDPAAVLIAGLQINRPDARVKAAQL